MPKMKPKPPRHIMLDIEAAGNRPGAIVLSIAAVEFHPADGTILGRFYEKIDRRDSERLGLRAETGAMLWWAEQEEAVRKEAFSGEKSVAEVLMALASFIGNPKEVCLWGNSARFDLGLLEAVYRTANIVVPWRPGNERDLRTIVWLAPEIKGGHVFEGNPHHPVDDAMNQVRYLMGTLRHLHLSL